MIVNFFLRLLVGHLLGDFVLQPLWLAMAKRKGWNGILIHVSIVTGVTGVMIWGSIPRWWIWLIVLFVIHVFIDQYRTFVFLDNSKGKGVMFFIFDQIIHVLSLVLISWMATGESAENLSAIFAQSLTAENAILFIFSLFVIAVWVIPILEIELLVAILSFQEQPETGKSKKIIEPIHLSDRLSGGVERTISLIMFGTGFGLLMPLVFIPRFIWMRKQNPPANRLSPLTKSGTSLVTSALLGLLLLSISLPVSGLF